MNSKGFTLVEIMITMAIMVAIVALTIPIYTNTVSGVSALSASEDTKLDNLLAMEMIRLDMQHVGTGIGINETTAPIIYDDTLATANRVLELHSTLVNTNQATFGWAMVNCTVGNAITTATDLIVDQRGDTTNTNLVLLDVDRSYIANTNVAYNCPTAAESGEANGTSVLYTAFPTAYVDAATPNACSTGFCTSVRYLLSTTETLETCAPGTFRLSRAVGGSIGGTPLINCVADFRVRFDIDVNNDSRIDQLTAAEVGQTNLPATASNIITQVKNIDMYLLVQIGKEDRSLRSAPNLIVDGITFTFPVALTNTNTQNNYRWKILKINGKPNVWF